MKNRLPEGMAEEIVREALSALRRIGPMEGELARLRRVVSLARDILNDCSGMLDAIPDCSDCVGVVRAIAEWVKLVDGDTTSIYWSDSDNDEENP